MVEKFVDDDDCVVDFVADAADDAAVAGDVGAVDDAAVDVVVDAADAVDGLTFDYSYEYLYY